MSLARIRRDPDALLQSLEAESTQAFAEFVGVVAFGNRNVEDHQPPFAVPFAAGKRPSELNALPFEFAAGRQCNFYSLGVFVECQPALLTGVPDGS